MSNVNEFNIDSSKEITSLYTSVSEAATFERNFGGVPKIPTLEESISTTDSRTPAEFVADKLREKAAVSTAASPQEARKRANDRLVRASSKKDFTAFELCTHLLSCHTVGLYGETAMIRVDDRYKPLTAREFCRLLQQMIPEEEYSRFSRKSCKKAIDRLIDLPQVTSNALEFSEGLVLFENGVYDIRTGEEVTPEQSTFFPVRVAANYRPWDDIPTPVFDDFLNVTFRGDRDLEELLLAVIGYLLLPNNPAKNFFVLGTAPDSGKSIIGNLIKELLGREGVCSIPLQNFSQKFQLAQIEGASVNLSMDLPEEPLRPATVSIIKMITGGDVISVERKFKDAHPYECFVKLLFGTNFPIQLTRRDEAFWNRLILVPFNYKVPKREQDPHLLEHLLQERDGIVQRAMRAVSKVMQNNWEFLSSHEAEYLKAEWSGIYDVTLQNFINDCCTYDEDAFTSTGELLELYQERYPGTGMTETRLGRLLYKDPQLSKARRIEHGNLLRGYEGLRIRTEAYYYVEAEDEDCGQSYHEIG